MELEYKEISIRRGDDDHQIKITYFTGTRALALAARITKKILPIFKSLGHLEGLDFSSGKPDLKKLVIGKDFFDTAVTSLLSQIDEKEVINLVLDMVRDTEVDGKSLSKSAIFDEVFQGKPDLMVQVIKEVFMANFAPFLPKMPAAGTQGN